MKKTIICLVFLTIVGKLLAQTPKISYLQVNEYPTALLRIVGNFDPIKGTVRINNVPLYITSWSDSEIDCDIDDSSTIAGRVTVTCGTDSASELLSFWRLHVKYWDTWSEGNQGDDQTVDWIMDFRVDLQALIDKRLSVVELQPSRYCKCVYSVDFQNYPTSVPFRFSGSGIVSGESYDSNYARGWSARLDLYDDLSARLQLGNVRGDTMMADSNFLHPVKYKYIPYDFNPPNNLRTWIDLHYGIEPDSVAMWTKGWSTLTGITLRMDSAAFLPPVTVRGVKIPQRDDSQPVTIVGRQLLLSPSSKERSIAFYNLVGVKSTTIELSPGQTAIAIPRLPSGFYLLRSSDMLLRIYVEE